MPGWEWFLRYESRDITRPIELTRCFSTPSVKKWFTILTGSVRALCIQGAAQVSSSPFMLFVNRYLLLCIKMSDSLQKHEEIIIDVANHCISFASLFAPTGALYVNICHFKSHNSSNLMQLYVHLVRCIHILVIDLFPLQDCVHCWRKASPVASSHVLDPALLSLPHSLRVWTCDGNGEADMMVTVMIIVMMTAKRQPW